jgi:regulator of replication initiation timing
LRPFRKGYFDLAGKADCPILLMNMDKKKKNFKFFYKSHWTAAILLLILNALFVPSVSAGGLTEANKENNGDGEPEFGVKVTMKDPDASARNSKLKKKLSFLRGELEKVHRENDALRREEKELNRKLEESLKEKEVLRKELIEILKKFEEQKGEYENLRLSFASIYAGDDMKNISGRERELLEELRMLSASGLKLATVTANMCDYVNSVVKNLKIDSLELARNRIKTCHSDRQYVRLRKFCCEKPENRQP